MKKLPQLLYIAPSNSTFVKKDIRLLSDSYQVRLSISNWYKTPLLIPFKFFVQFFQLIFTIGRYDAVVVMFGGYWSYNPALLGRVFRKRVIIIAGGTDCVSYPSINYGSLRKPFLRRIIGWSYSLASAICPVDESLIYSRNSYFNNSEQGIKHFFPKLKTPFTTIYNGYNCAVDSNLDGGKEPNSFITVALGSTKERFVLKGLDLIIENAVSFPKAIFYICGVDNISVFFPKIPENVKILGQLNSDEVNQMFRKAEFVVQISISEGFPNALCEGMINGCIPIISPVGAMPHIAGNLGFVLKKRSRESFFSAIESALGLSESEREQQSKLSVERISNNFPESKRGESLMKMFASNSSSEITV